MLGLDILDSTVLTLNRSITKHFMTVLVIGLVLTMGILQEIQKSNVHSCKRNSQEYTKMHPEFGQTQTKINQRRFFK